MEHKGVLNSARFFPNGGRVVTPAEMAPLSFGTWLEIGPPLSCPTNDLSFVRNSVRTPVRHHGMRRWNRPALGCGNGSSAVALHRIKRAACRCEWHASVRTTARSWLFPGTERRCMTTRPTDRNEGTSWGGGWWVFGAAFSPDSGRVLTWARDAKAQIWDVESGGLSLPPLEHQHGVQRAEFSADGRFILTVSRDQSVRIWNATSGKLACSPLRKLGPTAHLAARISPDRKRLLISQAGHTRLYDLSTSELAGPLILGAGIKRVGFVGRTRILAHRQPGQCRAGVGSCPRTGDLHFRKRPQDRIAFAFRSESDSLQPQLPARVGPNPRRRRQWRERAGASHQGEYGLVDRRQNSSARGGSDEALRADHLGSVQPGWAPDRYLRFRRVRACLGRPNRNVISSAS